MLWNVVVVLVTALVVLFGLRESVRRALVHELDAILIEDLKEVRLGLAASSASVDQQLLRELDRKAAGHQAHRWFVRLLDAQGETLWASLNEPTPAPSIDGPEGVPFGSGRYRLVQDRLRQPRGSVAMVQAGASTDLLESDIERIDRLVAIVVAVVIVLAPLCGYWLAGRALRPVADIIETASRLRPTLLEERLPDRGTGDELDRLARTINRLLDRIAVYLGERRDLLANSAHELRSPLAAMRSMVEVTLQSGRLTPEDEEALAIVTEESQSMERLVNQLLLLAETEAEGLIDRTETVPLDELVTSASEMFSAAAELKGISFERGEFPPVFVRGNRSYLRQVINNLLDNAVKFTPPDGTIIVSLGHNIRARAARLRVQNSGEGIAQEDLPYVFDRFFRVDRSRQRQGQGTGLGLSICQTIVIAHGGSITAESEVGVATTVSVTLPVVDPLADRWQPSPPLAPDWTMSGMHKGDLKR